ncbi:MAG TPA: UV DNA damage repair endonuclease UvsE [Nitrososphaeraceae archaeon]|nr:UV DNA damage repair endonuclease UvsE [Nitrososphaeraceae archaeon]
MSTFRLSSYTEEKFIQCVTYNLATLVEILKFNIANNLMFFRISSDVIPFASHPICKFDWKEYFKSDLIKIGQLIKHHNIRISMHPDQFVILNAKSQDIVNNSIRELGYHTDLLDLMELDYSSKVQIHIGGVYGDKAKSRKQFISNYKTLLPENIKKRLVIENDDHLYSLKDCIEIHEFTGIPILFDVFHHLCFDNNLPLNTALQISNNTWNPSKDGIMMIDYSNQELNQRKGKHSHTLDIKQFEKFITSISNLDLDIILEIKDKEKSAKKAIELINKINGIQRATTNLNY